MSLALGPVTCFVEVVAVAVGGIVVVFSAVVGIGVVGVGGSGGGGVVLEVSEVSLEQFGLVFIQGVGFFCVCLA